mmetsp:Transcript_10168/g.30518  ORF Transcript_10168/g.30518 Transcript_10168/m.30518 type:complete len:579 (+) Transcript_10168:487-2223(+)
MHLVLHSPHEGGNLLQPRDVLLVALSAGLLRGPLRQPVHDELGLLHLHAVEGLHQGLPGDLLPDVRGVILVPEPAQHGVEGDEALGVPRALDVVGRLLPDRGRVRRRAHVHDQPGVVVHDDGQQHVEDDERHKGGVGAEPRGQHPVRHARTESLVGHRLVAVPTKVPQQGPEGRVRAVGERAELKEVVPKQDVPRDREAKENGHEYDEEVEELVAGLDERVGHQLQPGVGLEGLEELQHDGQDVDAHHDLHEREEPGDPDEALLCSLDDGGVQAHGGADERQPPRAPLLEHGLDALCLCGEVVREPEHHVRPTHDDARPVHKVPEPPILLAAPAGAGEPHVAQQLLHLCVGGESEEQDVDRVYEVGPDLGVRLHDHRAAHDVGHHESVAIKVGPDLGDPKHGQALVPAGENEVQAIRVVVGPAPSPQCLGGGRRRTSEVPGRRAQVRLRGRRVQQPGRAVLADPAPLPQADIAQELAARGEGAAGLSCVRGVGTVAQERGEARRVDPLPHLRGVAHVLPVVGARVVGPVTVDPQLDAPLQLLPVPDLQVHDNQGDEHEQHYQGEGQRAEGVVAVHAPI